MEQDNEGVKLQRALNKRLMMMMRVITIVMVMVNTVHAPRII